METANVRNAFSGLVEDVRVLTAQRNELSLALHNVLAVATDDQAYIAACARPNESAVSCCARLIAESRIILSRAR